MPTAFNLKSHFRMCISPFKRFHTVKIHMKVKGLFKIKLKKKKRRQQCVMTKKQIQNKTENKTKKKS